MFFNYKKKTTIKKIVIIILIFLSFIFITGANYIKNTFGNVTPEEIVFNIKVPLTGTEMTSIYNYFKGPFLRSIISTLFILFCFLNNKISILKKIKLNKTCSIIIVLFFITSVGYFTLKLDINNYICSQLKNSSFIEDKYKNPKKVEMKFPEKKRNLIYIYLESMESSYTSTQNGGIFNDNIIPELTQLSNENISFSNTKKLGGAQSVPGTTWTVGALVTQTSGLPLKISITDNSISKYNTFLPGAYTLGDILKENGYNEEFILGSDASFSRRDSYFKYHGNYKIYDLNYAIKNKKMKEEDKVWWGFEDKNLFEWSKEELLKLSKKDKPFNFTMLTVDTHFEDGYLSKSCEKKYEDHYANVVSCSSKQVYDFVNWIKKQDFYENTTIIISGDHLTMDIDFFENTNKKYVRTVYNAFINPTIEPVNKNNRTFTTMDMFPSTLAAMGVEIKGDRLGLGTNLFSSEKTLAEKYGIEKLRNELDKTSKFYNKEFLYKK